MPAGPSNTMPGDAVSIIESCPPFLINGYIKPISAIQPLYTNAAGTIESLVPAALKFL
jgi:hypothetical protein